MIMEEHTSYFTQYECCGHQVPPWILNNHHYTLEKCHLREEQRRKRDKPQHYFDVSKVAIQVYLQLLESTAAFPFLGPTVALNNIDWVALYGNMIKA